MSLVIRLMIAACQGNRTLIESLLEEGALVNASDPRGQVPLHQVALMGHYELAEWFLDLDIDVDTQDINGNTPLHLAAYAGTQMVVALLLKKGARINLQNRQEETPLHVAVNMKQETVAEILLGGGADINKQNMDGDTPLHLASQMENQSLLALLLKRGAKVNFQNKEGYTALHESVLEGDKQSIQTLLQYGAYSYCYGSVDEYLEDYWTDIEINTETDQLFYTALLLAGVNTQGTMLPKPLSVIQNNIKITITNWFESFGLKNNTSSEVIPKILRAFPRLLYWFELLDHSRVIAAGSALFQEAEKDNALVFQGLDNIAMPAELMELIKKSFIQKLLIDVLVHRLIRIYELPHPIAIAFVTHGIANRQAYLSFYQKLFKRNWLQSHETSTDTQLEQNRHVLERSSL